ncbi:MAG: hypothetical protein ABFD77_00260 [Thermotogota bacterium]
MTKTRLFILVALLCAGWGLGAAAATATTVLDIAPGVGVIGAGGAGISLISSAETLYYNPAGLASLPGISFTSFFSSYLGEANYSALALTFRNFGVGALLLNSGSIQGYDDEGQPTELLGYSSSAYIFAFGIDPSDLPFLPDLPMAMAIGAQLKAITAKIGDVGGSGFTLDLGFRMGLTVAGFGPVSLSDVAIGITAVNLFGAMSYGDISDDLAMDLRIGASARLMDTITVAGDLYLAGAARFGVSYSPVPTLALRLGVMSGAGTSFTAGLGVNVQGFLVDYAYVGHTLGGSHRVSLTLDFSALDIGAFGRSLRRFLP